MRVSLVIDVQVSTSSWTALVAALTKALPVLLLSFTDLLKLGTINQVYVVLGARSLVGACSRRCLIEHQSLMPEAGIFFTTSTYSQPSRDVS